MQFSIDAVRDVAELLAESGLEEIAVESTDESARPFRLKLRREAPVRRGGAAPAAKPAAAAGENNSSATAAGAAGSGSKTIDVTATAVGLFRSGKKPVREGDTVARKQVLGAVESLKIPNDVLAPAAGRIAAILVTEGQGVEYGQVLFSLEPLDAEAK